MNTTEEPDRAALRLLEILSRELTLHSERQAHQELREAPRLNPFKYVRVEEVQLSKVISDLLDPKGTHGQREKLLATFLAAAGLPGLQCTNACVTREQPTGPGQAAGRIDIVVRGNDWILGIENKPWARDGRDQVLRYLSWLKAQCPLRFFLIYLPGDAREPAEISIPKPERIAALAAGHLRLMSYRRLSEWLDNACNAVSSDRVRWFLRSFAGYLTESVLGDLPKDEEIMITEIVLNPRHSGYLPAALELIQAGEAIKRALEKRLEGSIMALLPNGWTAQGSIAEGALAIRDRADTDWYFGIERDRARWCYGIKCDDRVVDRRRATLRRCGEGMSWGEQPNDYWPAWRWFDGRGEHAPAEYRDWNVSVIPWLDMANGTMATHLVELAKYMHELFRESLAATSLSRAPRP